MPNVSLLLSNRPVWMRNCVCCDQLLFNRRLILQNSERFGSHLVRCISLRDDSCGENVWMYGMLNAWPSVSSGKITICDTEIERCRWWWWWRCLESCWVRDGLVQRHPFITLLSQTLVRLFLHIFYDIWTNRLPLVNPYVHHSLDFSFLCH